VARNVRTNSFSRVIALAEGGKVMDLQIKLFRWLSKGHHVIALTRGEIDIAAVAQVFAEVAEITQPLADCKILIDLRDSKYTLDPADIHTFTNELRTNVWPDGSKIALLSAPPKEQYDQLLMLSSCLSNRGCKVAVFYDANGAASWLA
jgi:hypothetical protein